jgi:hypothetical protein
MFPDFPEIPDALAIVIQKRNDDIKKCLGPDGFRIVVARKTDGDPTLLGVAVEFFHDNDFCRAGVSLPTEPDPDQWAAALRLLIKTILTPDDPEVIFVRGWAELSGNTMKLPTPESK